jgi:hypothetical protein
MLGLLRNKTAQVVMQEYVVLIFIVMAVMMGMTVYFKRSVQGRIHDTRDYMVGEVRTRTAGQFNGDLYKEYEPYYGNTIATVDRTIVDETQLGPGASSGISLKIFNQTVTVDLNSVTLPPRDFNLTTPTN